MDEKASKRFSASSAWQEQSPGRSPACSLLQEVWLTSYAWVLVVRCLQQVVELEQEVEKEVS